jgi:Haem-degrading
MTYTLERLAAEQNELLLDRFDYDFAWALGKSMRDLAKKTSAPVAIEVTHGTALVFASLLPGATPDNLDWTARKRPPVGQHWPGGNKQRAKTQGQNHPGLVARRRCAGTGADIGRHESQ